MIKHQALLIEQVYTEILQMRSKLRLLLTNMCKFCWKNAGSTPTRGNIFFPKFYNPNLHNIARSDRIRFKTKNPSGDAKTFLSRKLTPKNHNVFFQNEVIFVQLDKLDQRTYKRAKLQEMTVEQSVAY